MNLLFANDKAGHYPDSYYAATKADLAPFPELKGATRANVCIIGGGYTGLSAALHLAKRGLDVVLVEAHRIGFGASGRNGGQVGSGQRQDQDWLEKTLGKDRAHQLWDLSVEAVELVKSLIRDHDMPCQFHPGIVHACFNKGEVDHARHYAEKLARDYGYDQVTPLDQAGLHAILPSAAYKGGIIDRSAGHVHPLNYAVGLARAAAQAEARIYENSLVHHIQRGAKPVVQTGHGRVECDHVILAGNGYLGGLDNHVAARVMPINNFIVATEPLGARVAEVLRENVAVADTKFVVNYWRLSDDNRLLFGGGESYGYRFPDIVKTVRKPMLEVYPGLKDVRIDYAWGGTLAITMNRMPCFARVAPNILSASGYSGHGVAMATLAGRLLAEATAGQAERFDVMANVPIQRFPGGPAMRWPLLALAMTWYSMRDRLGF
ncbi:MAG TPA: FAD-binding oxidoreductase [Paracoccaceae bacterium]|nr:FAD-binding oxidoreductase [Paracoccaceae bacterium]